MRDSAGLKMGRFRSSDENDWLSIVRLQRRPHRCKDVLAGVVDGNVLMGLEESDFADPFRTDAAGGKVGDTA